MQPVHRQSSLAESDVLPHGQSSDLGKVGEDIEAVDDLFEMASDKDPTDLNSPDLTEGRKLRTMNTMGASTVFRSPSLLKTDRITNI